MGTTPRHIADQAAMATKKFGETLGRVLRTLDMTASDLAREIGIDPSTLSRIISGNVTPTLRVAYSVFIGIRVHNWELGNLLGRELLSEFRPESKLDCDYNGDGKADIDDLPHAAAGVIGAADELLQLTLKIVIDGKVDDGEYIEVAKTIQGLRRHAERHLHLANQENARFSTAAARGGR